MWAAARSHEPACSSRWRATSADGVGGHFAPCGPIARATGARSIASVSARAASASAHSCRIKAASRSPRAARAASSSSCRDAEPALHSALGWAGRGALALQDQDDRLLLDACDLRDALGRCARRVGGGHALLEQRHRSPYRVEAGRVSLTQLRTLGPGVVDHALCRTVELECCVEQRLLCRRPGFLADLLAVLAVAVGSVAHQAVPPANERCRRTPPGNAGVQNPCRRPGTTQTSYGSDVIRRTKKLFLEPVSGAVLGGENLRRKPLRSGDQLGARQVEAGDEAQERARRRISCPGLELPYAALRNPRPQREGLLGELKLLSPFAQGDTERAEEAGRIWHRATLIGNRCVCNVVYVVHRAPDRGAMALRRGAVHTGS